MTDIEELKQRVVASSTFKAIASALLDIDEVLTQCEIELNLSGNMTDKSIVELEGKIRALKTLKHIGYVRVSDIKEQSDKDNKTRYEVCKVLKKEMPELYEELIVRVK